MWSPRFSLAVLTLFGFSTGPLLADVLVVDASGGGDFTNLPPAVDAAADGDTLLVKTGNYNSFILDAKGLIVVADAGASVTIRGITRIRFTTSGQDVLLSGLTFLGSAEHPALQLHSDAGLVRVQGCTLIAADGLDSGNPNSCPGVEIYVCADVAFTSCTLQGGRGWEGSGLGAYQGDGGAGLHTIGSAVTVYRCLLIGGLAGSSADYGGVGGRGGDGAHIFGEFVAVDSVFQAGDGGDGSDFFMSCGAGGAGLFVNSSGVVHELGCSFEGGQGGSWFFSGPHPCANGPDIYGSVTSMQGPPRALLTERVVREGQVFELEFQGVPGDVVHLGKSYTTLYNFLPSLRGVLLLTSVIASRPGPVGTISGSGTLIVPVTEWLLPRGVESRVLHTQAVFLDSAGQWILTNLQSRVTLSATFQP